MSENTEAPVIPVIGGTGALGSGLARRWAAGGARVIIGSRDAGRAAEVAAKVAGEAGGTVEGMSNADAAQAADDALHNDAVFRRAGETPLKSRIRVNPEKTRVANRT